MYIFDSILTIKWQPHIQTEPHKHSHTGYFWSIVINFLRIPYYLPVCCFNNFCACCLNFEYTHVYLCIIICTLWRHSLMCFERYTPSSRPRQSKSQIPPFLSKSPSSPRNSTPEQQVAMDLLILSSSRNSHNKIMSPGWVSQLCQALSMM